jgi:MerR family transcriptional regulator, light-induced transcriptional regulator
MPGLRPCQTLVQQLYICCVVDAASLRIGELSRRSGVSRELLRAWERRYGLLRPTRSAGGLRLYSAEDIARVRAMRQHLAEGHAAAEAAALVTRQPAGDAALPLAAARRDLDAAVTTFDETGAHAVIDSLLAQLSVEAVLRDAIVPYLHELGDRWESGEISVAQEHFASSLLRGRLLGLARGWGRGLGPIAVLACAPGEHHDLGLLAFGLGLRARGWRIVFLGPDTPLESVTDAARSSDPAFVVISSVDSRSFRRHSADLAELARNCRLCLGGAGAAEARLDADLVTLAGGAVDEAERLTQLALG